MQTCLLSPVKAFRSGRTFKSTACTRERKMNRFVVPLLLVVFSSFMLSQTTTPKTTAMEKAESTQRGAVVEEVIKNSTTEKAGFQEGDVLLTWNRGDATANIESSFDVSILAIEEGSRGNVPLNDIRGGAVSI